MGKRSGEAVAAQHRKAGPMSHRLKPRGGAKNDQPSLLEEENPSPEMVIEGLIREAKKRAADARHDYEMECREGHTASSEYSRASADTWDEVVSMLEQSR